MSRAPAFGTGGAPLAPLVARSGARLTPASVPIAVTRSGKIALFAGYEVDPRSFDRGLWVGTPDALRLIAKNGAVLRGMPDTILQEVRSIQLNERGQMVVSARVLQAEEPKQNLLRYSPAAEFESVVELDAIIDDHGTERAIAVITDFCDMQQRNQERCLDDDGRFAFMVTYSDQTQGLIITDPMPAAAKTSASTTPGRGLRPAARTAKAASPPKAPRTAAEAPARRGPRAETPARVRALAAHRRFAPPPTPESPALRKTAVAALARTAPRRSRAWEFWCSRSSLPCARVADGASRRR